MKTAKPQEQKQLELGGIMKAWCAANGIEQIRIAGGIKRVRTGLLSHMDIGSGYAICHPQSGKRSIEFSLNDDQTILHESSHMFLMLKKNFFTSSYFSSDRLKNMISLLPSGVKQAAVMDRLAEKES